MGLDALRRWRIRVVTPPLAQTIENEPREQGAGNRARAIGNGVKKRGVAADKGLDELDDRTQDDEPEIAHFTRPRCLMRRPPSLLR
jgi:hypothetical protein